jgi:uncharacterized alkaline shock family protein YloU
MIVGAVFIVWGSKGLPISMIKDYLGIEYNLLLLILGGLFLIVGLLSLYTTIQKKKIEKAVTLKGELGEVKISKYALEDYIKRLCLKESFVKMISVKVFLKRKKMLTKIKAGVWSGYNIPEIVSIIQNKVKGFLEDDLNLGEENEVKVFISKIIPVEGKKKAKSITLKEEEERGEAYP